MPFRLLLGYCCRFTFIFFRVSETTWRIMALFFCIESDCGFFSITSWELSFNYKHHDLMKIFWHALLIYCIGFSKFVYIAQPHPYVHHITDMLTIKSIHICMHVCRGFAILGTKITHFKKNGEEIVINSSSRCVHSLDGSQYMYVHEFSVFILYKMRSQKNLNTPPSKLHIHSQL